MLQEIIYVTRDNICYKRVYMLHEIIYVTRDNICYKR